MTTFEKEKKMLADAIKSGERKRVVVTLTPEMVGHLLDMNSCWNRRPSNARIKLLEESIKQKGFIESDEFKFHDGFLINGQHRLHALDNLYQKYTPNFWPKQEILVNISDEAARLVDTAQARTLKQRVELGCGIRYPSQFVSAVRFGLSHSGEFRNQVLLDDDAVLEELQSDSWQSCCADLSPSYKLSDSFRHVGITPPAYYAIKEYHDRTTKKKWKQFVAEFKGELPPSRPIRRLQSLMELGPQEVYAKYRDQSVFKSAYEVFYRLVICTLKAFDAGKTRFNLKPCDWED